MAKNTYLLQGDHFETPGKIGRGRHHAISARQHGFLVFESSLCFSIAIVLF